METYVSHRYNTVANFIATRPVMDLCLEAERIPGEQVYQRWREQDNLDLQEMWAAERAMDMTGTYNGEDGDDHD